MSSSEGKKLSRRKYLELTAGAVAGLAVGGALGYLAKPAEMVTQTATETVTVTGTVPPPVTTTAAAHTFPPATVTYWSSMYNQPQWNGTGYPLMRKLFQEKYPGCDVLSVGVDYSSQLEQQVIQLQSSNPPDVVQVQAPYISCIPFLEPLDDYIQRWNWPLDKMRGETSYPAKYAKYVGGDDKIYGAVQSMTPEAVAWYRKDILKEKGFDDPEAQAQSGSSPKWSLDEFLDIIRKCTFKRSDGTQVFGYAFPTLATDGVSRWREDWHDYLIAAGGGLVRPENPGQIICGKKPYLDANVAVGEFMRTLVSEKLVPVGVVKPSYFTMQITGQVTFTLGPPVQYALWDVPAQNPWGGGHQDQLPNMGTCLMAFFGKGWNYVDMNDAIWVTVAKNGRNKEAAFAILDLMCNNEEMAKYLSTVNYLFPANLDTIPPGALTQSFWQAFQESAKIANIHMLISDCWGLEKYGLDIWKAWFDMAQNIVYSNKDIQDMYVQLQGTLEKIVSAS